MLINTVFRVDAALLPPRSSTLGVVINVGKLVKDGLGVREGIESVVNVAVSPRFSLNCVGIGV
jgi:hypothetical protein